MKNFIAFVCVALISTFGNYVCAGSSGKVGHLKGIPRGQGEIYNQHGQLQQTWRTQPSTGNVEFYNKHGQQMGVIKPKR